VRAVGLQWIPVPRYPGRLVEALMKRRQGTGRSRRPPRERDRQPRQLMGRHRPSAEDELGRGPRRLAPHAPMSATVHPPIRKTAIEISVVEVEQLAVRPEHAAELLSMSDDFCREHVLPHVAVGYIGRLRLVPIGALTTWLEDSAVHRVGATRTCHDRGGPCAQGRTHRLAAA
jgi:hypothetical protein